MRASLFLIQGTKMSKITRREFQLGAGLSLAGFSALLSNRATANTIAMPTVKSEKPLSRILFGSCCHQDKPQPIWQKILDRKPELFLFLGDNIYGDSRDMAVLKAKYEKQVKNFAAIRNACDVIAIWDDHDYGENDAGKEYPFRDQSKELFFDFWNVPKTSKRRRDGDGIYTAVLYGPPEKRVHIILPDLRYNRDSLRTVSTVAEARERDLVGLGPYLPVEDRALSMLGEQQWQWLEKQMQIPSKIKIIGSSLQFISTQPGWEAWSNFPNDRRRMIDLIRKYRVGGVFFFSGDTHWAELSCQNENVPYPLWDLTSSGLTETWENVSPNIYRHNNLSYAGENFGALYIDWALQDPLIVFEIRNVLGERVLQHALQLSSLQVA